MDAGAYHGTLTSKLKPIVTMLTDALVRDFCPAYRHVSGNLWVRTDEAGHETLVNDAMLRADVEAWLLGLEHELDDANDREFAKMCAHMIRKNKGWVDVLTGRVKKRLADR